MFDFPFALLAARRATERHLDGALPPTGPQPLTAIRSVAPHRVLRTRSAVAVALHRLAEGVAPPARGASPHSA